MACTHTIGVVIVTHNSQQVIGKCIEQLLQQTLTDWEAVIVDSGSEDTHSLYAASADPRIRIIETGENVGFCRGNNIGYAALSARCTYILFLNPDAFLTEDFLACAATYMADENHAHVAALTGKLLGYNIADHRPTGRIDSTGVFRTWYGRWFDRHQGYTNDRAVNDVEEFVPAICGALMFCRKAALEQVQIGNGQIFDNTFYMYKEDIDLSLRLSTAGWRLAYLPSLRAYHCRGWADDRRRMPRRLRVLSARNDLRLCLRHTKTSLGYALAKYLFVRWLEK